MHEPQTNATSQILQRTQVFHYTGSEGTKQATSTLVVYELTEGNADKRVRILLLDEIGVRNYCANTDFTGENAIDLYHTQGENEQFHSELKSDMDVGRYLGFSAANSMPFVHCLQFAVAMITFNIRIMMCWFR